MRVVLSERLVATLKRRSSSAKPSSNFQECIEQRNQQSCLGFYLSFRQLYPVQVRRTETFLQFLYRISFQICLLTNFTLYTPTILQFINSCDKFDGKTDVQRTVASQVMGIYNQLYLKKNSINGLLHNRVEKLQIKIDLSQFERKV